MAQKLLLNLFVCLALIIQLASQTQIASVRFVEGKPIVTEHEHVNTKCGDPALAIYSDANQHPSHFATLTIQTLGNYSDSVQAYSAGYLEGKYTAEGIYNLYMNTRNVVNESGWVPQNLTKFFSDQSQWVNSQVEKYKDDYFWQYIGLLQQQANGIMDGYRDSDFGQHHQLDNWAFQFLESVGDIFDIKVATNQTLIEEFKQMSYEERLEQKYFCSAIIKMADNFSDILAGHTTWWQFASMIRIFKRYEFNFNNPMVVSKKMAFSSYPGMISSWDDFYMMDSQLLLLQTTNNIADAALYDLIKPQTLYSWQRVRVANAFSQSGMDWYKYISMFNSGTYTNMYMVLNYGLFQPGNALKNNTLWVIETAPGLVYGEDKTNQLQRQYWPSFNQPYFPVMYKWMGYEEKDKNNSQTFGTQYQQYFRSQISRRDQHTINDLQSLWTFLRYNNYTSDPFSKLNPSSSICARGDLNETVIKLSGCTDTKVTNYELFSQMKTLAVNGPTYDNLPPFEWLPRFNQTTHLGVPSKYDFQMELLAPYTPIDIRVK